MSAHLKDELLTAALDGSLSGTEGEAVDAHLAVCEQCRGDLELARGARGALRSLPNEIRPPIDVAAAVTSELAGGRREGRGAAAAPSGPPRWYRAAGLVAAAAAIVLGVLIVPRLSGDEQQDRTVTAAVGADTGSAPEAGYSAAAGSEAGKLTPVVEGSSTDYDAAGLQDLLAETVGSPPESSATTPDATAQLAAQGQRALDCVLTAAGDSIPTGARPVRLIDATFQGSPATIGVFSLPDGGGRAWVAARDDCRLLATATNAG